jgi:hypothetical protein
MLSGLPLAPALGADTAITIYSSAQPGAVDADAYRPVNGHGGYVGMGIPGYAVVRQVRNVNLAQLHTITKFSDVAALIDPTTVQFKSLTDPQGTKVAEQNYQFDLSARRSSWRNIWTGGSRSIARWATSGRRSRARF